MNEPIKKPVQGKSLSECFKLVSDCGNELNGLYGELETRLAKKIDAEQRDLLYSIADKTIEKSRMDESGWVCTDTAFSIPLKPKGKGKRNPEKYLCCQISVTGDGIGNSDIFPNPEPLLHVLFWSDPVYFNDNYMGFPFNTEESFQIEEGRFMRWGNGGSDGWNYSLRLTKLNTPEDLEKYVVNPVIALLSGKFAKEALPTDGNDVILTYPGEEKLKNPE